MTSSLVIRVELILYVMDYSTDVFYTMFTAGQEARMFSVCFFPIFFFLLPFWEWAFEIFYFLERC